MVKCLLCGKEFRALPVHIIRTHGMEADDYKIQFGLPLEKGLICDETREMRRERMLERIESGELDILAAAEKGRKSPRTRDRRHAPSLKASLENIQKRDLDNVRDGIRGSIERKSHVSQWEKVEMPCSVCGVLVKRNPGASNSKKAVCRKCRDARTYQKCGKARRKAKRS